MLLFRFVTLKVYEQPTFPVTGALPDFVGKLQP